MGEFSIARKKPCPPSPMSTLWTKSRWSSPRTRTSSPTQCYCCMQSFYISFPGCCGGNREEECICCSSAAGGKCLQIEDGTKTWDSQVAMGRCLDYTQGDLIVEEAACQRVNCCCIVGAAKAWCGIKDFKG